MNYAPLGRLLRSACVIFTVLALLLCVGQMLFAAEATVIYPLSFVLLYPFSLCFAGANLLARHEAVSKGVRVFAHFGIVTLGAVLFVFLPAGVFATGSSALVIVSAYVLLYWLGLAAVAGVRSVLRRANEA